MARITSISTPYGGAGIQFDEAEKIKARRLISFLEDRRVLFSDYTAEVPEECVQSIQAIRQFLTDEIGGCKSNKYCKQLKFMRSECRRFLDTAGHSRHFRMNPFDDARFFQALGSLRGVFGVYIEEIARKHKIEVEEELKKCFPTSD